MKLYVIYDIKKNKIKAHSRDKKLHKAYLKTLKGSRYVEAILNTNDKNSSIAEYAAKEIHRIEDEEFDKTLSFMHSIEEPVTEDERDIFKLADEEYEKLEFIVKDMKNIIDNYELNKADKKQLKRAYDILKALKKRENFDRATGLDTLREVVKNSPLINLRTMFTFGGKQK